MNPNIEKWMVRTPYVASRDMKPQVALDMMKELEFRHLPVVEDGRLVGIISDRDLREISHLPQASLLVISDIMRKNVYAVRRDAPLKEIVLGMLDRRIGSAIVLNARQEVVGIFTTTDALRVLSDLLDDGEEGLFLDDDLYESWEDVTEAYA